jgi:hypothetical protein
VDDRVGLLRDLVCNAADSRKAIADGIIDAIAEPSARPVNYGTIHVLGAVFDDDPTTLRRQCPRGAGSVLHVRSLPEPCVRANGIPEETLLGDPDLRFVHGIRQ